MAKNPDIASWPAILAAICVFSASVRPANFARSSSMVSFQGFIDPSAFFTDNSSAAIAFAAFLGGATRRVMMARNDVPACSALMPAFAMRPMETPTSSTEYFNAPAIGATYLNVYPIMPTLVLAFDAACASTSAKCAESDAFSPKAVKASVTISETLPKSSPDAAASDIMPDMPLSISSVFHPAIAIYSSACADSVAENCVVAPISFALAVKDSKSPCDAPDMACTRFISASKSMYVLTVS